MQINATSTYKTMNMEEKELNLVEILKDAPKGTKLYSPICGNVKLESAKNGIVIVSTDGVHFYVNANIYCI